MTDPMMRFMTGLITSLAVAGVSTIISDVLVILALAVLVITAVGMTFGRSPLTRMHFLAPAGTLALPLFGLAAMINQGPTLGAAAAALAVVAGALSSPVLATSIARLLSSEDNVAGGGDDHENVAVIDDHQVEERR